MPRHTETRIVPYRPRQMFDLVADIGRYPEFLPWCHAARVTKREGDVLTADLVVGNRVFRESFTSKVRLTEGTDDDPARPPRIDVEYVRGPMRHMRNHWVFQPVEEGTEIDFDVEFDFRSRLLQSMVRAVFTDAVRRMVSAFEKRAGEIYGADDGMVRQPAGPA